MPVLSLEPSVFPEQLLQDLPFGQQPAGGVWWVAHTKPRTEKTLARQLLHRSVPFFLPLYARKGRHRNKVFVSRLPLFPGYLFLCTDAEARIEALRTNLIVRTIPVVDQQRLSHELVAIHRLIESGVLLAPEERLQPGMWVEICSGPLKGLEGKIIRCGGQRRFMVEVDFLRRGASVEIDGWAIRPLEAGGNSRLGHELSPNPRTTLSVLEHGLQGRDRRRALRSDEKN